MHDSSLGNDEDGIERRLLVRQTRQNGLVNEKKSLWYKYLPITKWLFQYNIKKNLVGDVTAGLCVGIMILPQALAHAKIAGVPPQHALFCSVTALIIYPLFGTSKEVSVSNTALSSFLVASAISTVTTTSEKIAVGVLVGFFSGVLILCIGIFRLGFILDYFSRPVMAGYVSGASTSIVLDQLRSICGLRVKRSDYLIPMLYNFFANLKRTNFSSLGLGLLTILFLLGSKRLKKILQRRLVTMETSSLSMSNSETQRRHTNYDKVIPQTTNALPSFLPEVEFSRSTTDTPSQLVQIGEKRESIYVPPTSTIHSPIGIFEEGHRESMYVPPISENSTKGTHRNGIWWKVFPNKCESNSWFFKRWMYKISIVVLDFGAFTATALGILLSYILIELLDNHSLSVAGKIPQGLPSFTIYFNDLSSDQLLYILPKALVIGIVSFATSIAVAKRIAFIREYEVDTNQEARAYGIAQIVASFFQAMPISVALSRTAVNMENAKTQLSSIISSLCVIFSLLWLTPVMYYIPNAVLSAIIIVAAASIVDFSVARWFYKVKKNEFYVWMASYCAVLLTGLMFGLLLSVSASLLDVMYRSRRSKITLLGKEQSTEEYMDISKLRGQVVKDEDKILICRIESSLSFVNSETIQRWLLAQIHPSLIGELKGVVLDLSSVNDIDSSSLQALTAVFQAYEKAGVQLVCANAKDNIKHCILTGLGKWSKQQDVSYSINQVVEEVRSSWMV